jgi:tRNA U34 5-methylaminomethyl-2-thiouridine-forming methyltransferase MnmC
MIRTFENSKIQKFKYLEFANLFSHYLQPMKREIIQTADGSNTIYIPDMDENYHSSHGALQEALHVFIKNGLDLKKNLQQIDIFEMGFGTGLNALLTFIEAEKGEQQISYKGIEAYPVEQELIQVIRYQDLVNEKYHAGFQQMHELSWNEPHELTSNFTFKKIHAKIEEYQIEEESVDLVFYDAFGPRAQEAMWHPRIFKKMYDMLKPTGIFVTYCAKGQVKRDLKALGFTIEAVPGPPGKREMTLAHKN